MTMIMVDHDKRSRGKMFLIPMKNEDNSEMFNEVSNSATWVYYCDGRPHKNTRTKRTIPTMVIPELADIWGGLDDVIRAGYRKHWTVFQDLDTGLYYFGNYPSLSKSRDPEEVARASEMLCIDINILREL